LNILCRNVCRAARPQVWQGCFRANPERVAFSLFCRLMMARESPDAAEVSSGSSCCVDLVNCNALAC
jgi:hypothetical protein